MKVAVVGPTGYIGSHLCELLARSGVEVVRISAGQPGGISIDTGLFDPDFAFGDGIEAVYFLAQSPFYHRVPERAAHVLAVNCVAATQAAEAARRAGVRRFIYASTGNVYAPSFLPLAEDAPVRSDNWYALSKLAAEQSLLLFRPTLDVTCVRIFGVYGPGQVGKLVPTIARSVHSGKVVYVDRNAQNPDDLDGLRVSLCYIDDLVASLAALLRGDGVDVLNLAGPSALSIRELAEAFGGLFGVQPQIEVSSKERKSDLIANVGRAERLLAVKPTPYLVGLGQMARAEQLLAP